VLGPSTPSESYPESIAERTGPTGEKTAPQDSGPHFQEENNRSGGPWQPRLRTFLLPGVDPNGEEVVLEDGRVRIVYDAVGSEMHPRWGVHGGAVIYRRLAQP
jgi:hypothetical protein